MLDVVTDKISQNDRDLHDENRQGEAFAPFIEDPNLYKKRFYIKSNGCSM